MTLARLFLMEATREEVLRKLGFLCLEPTKVRFIDGTDAVVTAHSFCDGTEQEVASDVRARRFYSVAGHTAPTEIINELALESRMGRERFWRLL